ncbi:MAG: class I SAM-dependent methyltransferase [Acidobacteriaceae bacterium]|nr:class I SAM-dependent methyltransferase [Acidobacteriaceae bacterium]
MSATNSKLQLSSLPENSDELPAGRNIYIVRRALTVRLLKALLVRARAIAPRWLYSAFQNVGFSLWKKGLRVLYSRKVLAARLRGDREGFDTYRNVYRGMQYSLVGSSGLEATYRAALELLNDGIKGCFVECGVAEGGCAALLATVAQQESDRVTWLFDSFEGLPDPTAKDFVDPSRKITGENIRPLERGSCLGTLDRVQDVLFGSFHLNRAKVHLVKGWFQDTLPIYRHKLGPLAMLRIDGDWYESTKVCLENLFDQLVPDGYCIIDDYGTYHGCRRAVNEFLQDRNLRVQAASDGRGGILFRKPASASSQDLEVQQSIAQL